MFMLKRIKIFVSHRPEIRSYLIKNRIFINVNCGATLFPDVHRRGVVGDNTGVNISEKGKSLNELTVQYWAWKNYDLDYYGLCHYRRYLSFSEQLFPVELNGDIGHVLSETLDYQQVKKYCLNSRFKMSRVIEQYDMIYSAGIPLEYYNKAYKQNNVTMCQLWLNQSQLIPNTIFIRLLKILEDMFPLIHSSA